MIVLAVLALLVFGPEGLPGIIKTVMRTVNAVKIAARDFQTEVKTALDAENERQDLAKRQRTPIQEPQRNSAALAAAAVPPMPEAEGSETTEESLPEADRKEVATEPPSEGEPEVSETAAEDETAPEELVEEEEDDDGPRIPMGGTARKRAAKEVSETT